MATVYIALVGAGARSGNGDAMPVADPIPFNQANITSSGTSQQTGFAAPGDGVTGRFWSITATGGNVRVKFGANPTAAATDWLILDGQTREFAAVGGHKCAVINA